MKQYVAQGQASSLRAAVQACAVPAVNAEQDDSAPYFLQVDPAWACAVPKAACSVHVVEGGYYAAVHVATYSSLLSDDVPVASSGGLACCNR